jgi:hypothetical protein
MSQALSLSLIISVAVGIHVSLTSPTPTAPKNRRVMGDYPGILYIALLILKVSNLHISRGLLTEIGRITFAFALVLVLLLGPCNDRTLHYFGVRIGFGVPLDRLHTVAEQ